jgi:glycosyltransferase involved in cell wall biosynthesis
MRNYQLIFAQGVKWMKILYEITYAARGKTGIPRDTKALAEILLSSDGLQSDLILNPRGYTRRKNKDKRDLRWASNELGDALRNEPGQTILPSLVLSALTVLQSFSPRRLVHMLQLNGMQSSNVFSFLHLEPTFKQKYESQVLLLMITYASRFVRPGYLKPFRIKTSGYDIFIQQQVDPIYVSKKTTHIVRLHDILPISHPQYFNQDAVDIFTKSLSIMLKGSRKIWVMDTQHSANEFKEYFGNELDVRIVPCVVQAKKLHAEIQMKKLNQICLVNTIEPRKRTKIAIDGFIEAKREALLPQDWQLVIVGKEGWQEKSLAENLRGQVFGPDIVFKENCSDFDLEKVYSESKIVLSATAAEGFGLTPLEGMAYGCLPVVSDIPQHHETIQDLGLYFEVDSPQRLAEKLGLALEILSENELDVSKKLMKHVRTNYSEEVISKKWLDLLLGVQN